MYTKSIIWRFVVAIAICSAALILSTACDNTDDEIVKDADITVSNQNDLKQAAYADEPSTGNGITFTAKDNWLANVKANGGGNASWVKLTINGVETYSGSAGTYNLVITVETNYTGAKREATVEIVCGTDRITVTVAQEGTTKGGDKPTQNPVELKSPITTSTTLKALGLPVDYIYTGNNQLEVKDNATLTIEPGVTIQFTNNGRTGGIIIRSGSTIKAVGTADKRIKFLGAYEAKGTWQGIELQSNTDNQFAYCDFLNMGHMARTDYGGLQFTNAKVAITHCKLTNGLGTGIRFSSTELSAFNNNVFESYADFPPIEMRGEYALQSAQKFDMTSDFTKNGKLYIEIDPYYTRSDITLNQTSVPYYFTSGPGSLNLLWNTLTINAGVTIYIKDGMDFNSSAGESAGRLMINGTADKKVRFTRLPGSSLYWGAVSFHGLKGSVINHCIFEYGGRVQTNNAIIQIRSTTELTLNNVAINNSDSYGAMLWSSANGYKLTHNNVTFSNCRQGNVWDTRTNPPVIRTHFP